ncbi:MAG TPA: Fis family transcriptional regulator, partial [Anaeromyxobacteraceae bacterium]|nr:Fis family transcriptional regulator [Anaeromyxobacteraceae bacterium]
MAEIDDELMARVLQWCAEAGHPSSPAEVRDALSSLSWDALLAVRAVLADPPPTQPLGPAALADIARGTAPEIAAQRERDRAPGAPVGATGEEGAAPSAPPAARAPETKKARGKATRRIATVVIRRARDRREDDTPGDAPPPLLDDLFLSEGRAVLERWVRRHGARRARLVEELSAWRRPDGSPPGDDDLARLLDAHGLTRPFERREREEILHAVRASGGTLAGAAHALGISTDALAASTERVGIATEVERIRDERRD